LNQNVSTHQNYQFVLLHQICKIYRINFSSLCSDRLKEYSHLISSPISQKSVT
jgi:hypothetical protein